MPVDTSVRLKRPAHPGSFIRHDILEPIGLSVSAAASVLGIDDAALSPVLDEQARLSPEIALRIEKAFGVQMDTLMRMQSSFDIAQARQRENEIDVRRYQPVADAPL